MGTSQWNRLQVSHLSNLVIFLYGLLQVTCHLIHFTDTNCREHSRCGRKLLNPTGVTLLFLTSGSAWLMGNTFKRNLLHVIEHTEKHVSDKHGNL